MLPPPQAMMAVSDFTSITLQIIAVVLPLIYLVKTRRFAYSVMWMWFAMWIWSILACAVIPFTLARLLGNSLPIAYFPEMPGIVAMTFTGWLPSLLICGVVSLAHKAVLKLRSPVRVNAN